MRIFATVVLLVTGALGCSNDLADLFGPSDAGVDSGVDSGVRGAADKLDPYAAALRIYGDEPACVACIERECEPEARACADEPACVEDARCRADCDGDLACQLWTCANRYPLDDRPTTPLEDQCVQVKCIEACRVGQNFDCVGKYGRPRPDGKAPVLSVQLTAGLDQAPFQEAGIRARVCPWGDIDCDKPVGDDVFSDDAGIVTIPFPAPMSSALQLNPFNGYVEFIDGQDPPRTRPVLFVPQTFLGIPSAPPTSNTETWPLALAPEGILTLASALLGVEWLPGRGMVAAAVWDCRFSQSWRASGATLEVEQGDAETIATYGVGPGNTETDRTGIANLWNVPPGIVTLSALHQGRQISTVDVPVRADAMTVVLMAPNPAR